MLALFWHLFEGGHPRGHTTLNKMACMLLFAINFNAAVNTVIFLTLGTAWIMVLFH